MGYAARLAYSREVFDARYHFRMKARERRRQEAAARIQEAWRAFWQAILAWKRSFTPSSKRIQCAWRQYLARRRCEAMRAWWAHRHAHARVIQAWFRPYLDAQAEELHEEVLIELAKQEVKRQKILKKASLN